MRNNSGMDYEVMGQSAAEYESRAGEINELCQKILRRNEFLVENGWNGDSAMAFKERFETDHAKKLMSIAQELQDLAKTLRDVVSYRQEWEQSTAANLRG